MILYEFKMAEDKSHAIVLLAGKAVATIQNTPDYLGGGLNMAQNGAEHGMPLHKVGNDMWDQFYAWADENMSVEESK